MAALPSPASMEQGRFLCWRLCQTVLTGFSSVLNRQIGIGSRLTLRHPLERRIREYPERRALFVSALGVFRMPTDTIATQSQERRYIKW